MSKSKSKQNNRKKPKTEFVRGHTKKDGTNVPPYLRSKPKRKK